MPRVQGPGELAMEDAMVAGLPRLMHINEQILLIDGNLNMISFFQVGQALILSHIHRNEPRLPFARIDSGLVTSHFFYCTEKYPMSGKMLCITLLSRRTDIRHENRYEQR